jgi:hypothetical protein
MEEGIARGVCGLDNECRALNSRRESVSADSFCQLVYEDPLEEIRRCKIAQEHERDRNGLTERQYAARDEETENVLDSSEYWKGI